MTREETKKLMMVIVNSYPNYKPVDLSVTVDIWSEMLKDYEAGAVMMALKTYIVSDTTGFAPSIGQLIGKMNVVSEMSELNEMEAWGLVSKALRDATYHAKERYDELPETVKKAVGSPDNLRAWGMDEAYNENVAQSQFINCYRNVLKRKSEVAKLPSEVRTLIEATTKRMIEG